MSPTALYHAGHACLSAPKHSYPQVYVVNDETRSASRRGVTPVGRIDHHSVSAEHIAGDAPGDDKT